MTTSSRPKVLRLGSVEFAHEKWAQLAEIAEVIQSTSQTRQEFLEDLSEKYNDVTHIARTFASVEQTGRFDEELASHLPHSVVSVSHNGAGYDQIDVDAFTARGVQVSNVTVPVEGPTADTAVYLVLSCLRNFQQGHNILASGGWDDKKCGGAALGRNPESKVVGILGMGGIGRAIRDRLIPFGFKKIIYHNRSQLKSELENGAEYVSYDELLSQSDIICLSIPLNSKTRHSIDKQVIEKMKDGVIIVNTARGAIIDEAILPELIKSGKIGAFGSDVFEHEPQVSPELYSLPNVVSLPHMGTHSVDAIKNMEEWVVENVETCIKTGKVKTIVPEQYNIKFQKVLNV
ncbi:Glyoxylate reductase 1 [Spathaspora sp. JA1]|nr:Glyoxylate reductase 1 [Spathaspora sp. JA1]